MITIYFEITKAIVAIYYSSHTEVFGDGSIVDVYIYFIMIEGTRYVLRRNVYAI